MPIFAFTWTILFYKSMPLQKDDKRFYVFVITCLIKCSYDEIIE